MSDIAAKLAQFTKQPPIMYNQGLYEASTVAKHTLGTIRPTEDGRMFVYAKLGAANSVAGNWYQSIAGVGVAEDTVTVAHAVNTTAVTITEVGAAGGITLNEYQDGWLVVDAGSGIGEIYKIRGNAAIANAANGTVYLYDRLATAWSTSTTNVHIYKNPFNGVLVGNKGLTTPPIGVAPRIYPANNYVWLQYSGPGALVLEVGTGGAEIDEKVITCSINTDGIGFIDGSPNLELYSYNYKLGHLLHGAGDVPTGEATLVYIDIHA